MAMFNYIKSRVLILGGLFVLLFSFSFLSCRPTAAEDESESESEEKAYLGCFIDDDSFD